MLVSERSVSELELQSCAWCAMLLTTSRALLDLSLIDDEMLLLRAQGVAGLVVLPSSSKLTMMNQHAPAGNKKH